MREREIVYGFCLISFGTQSIFLQKNPVFCSKKLLKYYVKEGNKTTKCTIIRFQQYAPSQHFLFGKSLVDACGPVSLTYLSILKEGFTPFLAQL